MEGIVLGLAHSLSFLRALDISVCATGTGTHARAWVHTACARVRECVRGRERGRVCVCVYVRARECMCVRARARVRMSASACVGESVSEFVSKSAYVRACEQLRACTGRGLENWRTEHSVLGTCCALSQTATSLRLLPSLLLWTSPLTSQPLLPSLLPPFSMPTPGVGRRSEFWPLCS